MSNRLAMNHDLRRWVLHTLAVHRLVQLWTTDRVTRPVRARLARWLYAQQHSSDDDPVADLDDADVDEFASEDVNRPYWAELLYCWWCVGWWVSLAWWFCRGARGRTLVKLSLATSTGIIIVHNAIARLAPPDK